MKERESSVVSETESETGRPGERQGQLYTKTKKGKAVGIPTTVFLPKEETFTAWKSSIRNAIAELECISLVGSHRHIAYPSGEFLTQKRYL